ncbi:STAS domain-containing protein [Candidatus Peregrinibacteria bacterium]|nr:MAG: STAS domain-containing protein [Candidatus Peregrinibacteria bacterium]
MSSFSVSVSDRSTDSMKIFSFSGEMDEITLADVRTQVDPLLMDPMVKTIIFDLSELNYINSKGIGYLVAVHTHLSKDQRVLILSGATESVMDVIMLVGLPSIIRCVNTVEEALAS